MTNTASQPVEAEAENDLFRVAFEDACKDDKPEDVEQTMFAFDFFKYGWQAAIRCLGTTIPATEPVKAEAAQVRRRAVAEIEYVADSLPGNDSLEFSVFEMQSMIFAYRETKRRLTMAENKLATPSSSFLAAHKIKKYQARAVRIAMEVLKRHAESDAESFKALKALEHNFKDYL